MEGGHLLSKKRLLCLPHWGNNMRTNPPREELKTRVDNCTPRHSCLIILVVRVPGCEEVPPVGMTGVSSAAGGVLVSR